MNRPVLALNLHASALVAGGEFTIAGGKVSAYAGFWNTDPTGIGAGGAAPQHFALAQNRPNPFNPTTTIEYTLADPGRVTLTIFSATGGRVRTLVDETQVPKAGGFAVVWDGRDDGGRSVASGVYFCRLEAGQFSKTRKLILVK